MVKIGGFKLMFVRILYRRRMSQWLLPGNAPHLLARTYFQWSFLISFVASID